LPVNWHQCLLVFAQRYRDTLSVPQKNRLKNVLKEKQHYLITPEIRRELFGAKAKDDDVAM
jgi:essential nuclear protein 1